MAAYRGFSHFLVFLLFLISGCGRESPAPQATPDKIKLIATAYPMADIARQVGGPALDCDWIAEQGQSLDAIDPTPEVISRIRQAELVISNGVGEEWAVRGFDDPLRNKSVIRLDLLESAKPDLGAGCRQLWLDPAVAKDLANLLPARLRLRRPNQEKLFYENAARFAREIDQITHEFAPRLDALRGRKVLTLSPNYVALLRSVGLEEIRPISTSPLRLSDDDLRTLRQTIRSDAPIAMLVDVDIPAAVQQDLSQRLGIPVVPIDSLGTSAGVGRNTYQAILRYNLEQLSTLAGH